MGIGEASALDANESLLFLLLKVVERSEAFFFFFPFFCFPPDISAFRSVHGMVDGREKVNCSSCLAAIIQGPRDVPWN